MSKETRDETRKAASPSRAERLAAELRANLLRRKDQARARATDATASGSEEPASGDTKGRTTD